MLLLTTQTTNRLSCLPCTFSHGKKSMVIEMASLVSYLHLLLILLYRTSGCKSLLSFVSSMLNLCAYQCNAQLPQIRARVRVGGN